MYVRIVKVDELQFLVCLKNNIWASNVNSFKNWSVGDKIILTVDKQIAALAVVTKEFFYDDEFIWDNSLYPYRIPIEFVLVASREKRLPISDVKELLINSWGEKYGWGIQNQTPLKPKDGEVLLKLISHYDGIDGFRSNIDALINHAKEERLQELELIRAGVVKEKDRKYKPALVDI